jgi:uncharacterized membrane protein
MPQGTQPVKNTTFSPANALFLGMAAALFLGALLSDLAYAQTFEIQWANFSAWLIAGGLLAGGIVLAMAIVNFFRGRDGTRPGLYLGLVALMWIVGFINALVHARDGWAMMPTGLILSLIVTLLALVAAGAGLRRTHRLEVE